ncbi:HlyD family secretion protein [Xenorhabdus thailandensis]|uniref:HlyD family secretion protein n=1 Tax=Xenorhabdus thailandensis TaxID=3136255 RepID=UPI0030F3F001
MLGKVRIKWVLRFTLIGALIFAGASWGWDWFNAGRYELRIDNAYVRGDITAIAPRVSGHVVELQVTDNQPVRQGDVLFRIDDHNYRAMVASAEAAVAQAEAAIGTLAAQRKVQESIIDQSEATIAEVQANLDLARRTFNRTNTLVDSRAVSVASVDLARADLGQAEARLRAAQASRLAAQRQLEYLDSQRAAVAATLALAKASLDASRVDLDSTVVRAPVDGVVGSRDIQVGRYVSAGTRMLDLVPIHRLWVEANPRETYVGQVLPGQPVRISVDGFPDARIAGVVESIAPGSGAAFSLIPPDNATGNFVRIVQRVPVKIRLTDVPKEVRLVPGLSARVAIRTNGLVQIVDESSETMKLSMTRQTRDQEMAR